MGFDPTTLVFERAKTLHALDLGATVIGSVIKLLLLLLLLLRGLSPLANSTDRATASCRRS
jgi:hypothetical protein